MALQVREPDLKCGIEVVEEDAPHVQPALAGAHAPADGVALVRREPLPGWGEVTVRIEMPGKAVAGALLPAHRASCFRRVKGALSNTVPAVDATLYSAPRSLFTLAMWARATSAWRVTTTLPLGCPVR
jgi:hypothetical protein